MASKDRGREDAGRYLAKICEIHEGSGTANKFLHEDYRRYGLPFQFPATFPEFAKECYSYCNRLRQTPSEKERETYEKNWVLGKLPQWENHPTDKAEDRANRICFDEEFFFRRTPPTSDEFRYCTAIISMCDVCAGWCLWAKFIRAIFLSIQNVAEGSVDQGATW